MGGLLAWENLVDAKDESGADRIDIALGPDATGDDAFPLSNLRLRGKAEFARCSGAAFGLPITLLELTGGGEAANLIALLGVRKPATLTFVADCTIQLQYDTGGLGGWVSFAEASFVLPEDGSPVDLFFVPQGGQITLDAIRVVLTAGGPVGYIARLWAGPALLMPDGIDAGWALSFREKGALDETPGAQVIESPGVRLQVLDVPLESAHDTERMWGISSTTGNALEDDFPALYPDGAPPSLHRMMFEAGCTGEVIAIPRTLTPTWIKKAAVYGHIEQTWSIGHKAGSYWGASFRVVQEL